MKKNRMDFVASVGKDSKEKLVKVIFVRNEALDLMYTSAKG